MATSSTGTAAAITTGESATGARAHETASAPQLEPPVATPKRVVASVAGPPAAPWAAQLSGMHTSLESDASYASEAPSTPSHAGGSADTLFPASHVSDVDLKPRPPMVAVSTSMGADVALFSEPHPSEAESNPRPRMVAASTSMEAGIMIPLFPAPQASGIDSKPRPLMVAASTSMGADVTTCTSDKESMAGTPTLKGPASSATTPDTLAVCTPPSSSTCTPPSSSTPATPAPGTPAPATPQPLAEASAATNPIGVGTVFTASDDDPAAAVLRNGLVALKTPRTSLRESAPNVAAPKTLPPPAADATAPATGSGGPKAPPAPPPPPPRKGGPRPTKSSKNVTRAPDLAPAGEAAPSAERSLKKRQISFDREAKLCWTPSCGIVAMDPRSKKIEAVARCAFAPRLRCHPCEDTTALYVCESMHAELRVLCMHAILITAFRDLEPDSFCPVTPETTTVRLHGTHTHTHHDLCY